MQGVYLVVFRFQWISLGHFFLKLAIPGMSLQAVRASLRDLAREVITAATFHHAAIHQHHRHHHHHHAWSRRVFSPFRSFHPNLESPDWFMCLVQYFLVVPAGLLISSNDLNLKNSKKLISGKEDKSGCLFSMMLIVIRDMSLYIERVAWDSSVAGDLSWFIT